MLLFIRISYVCEEEKKITKSNRCCLYLWQHFINKGFCIIFMDKIRHQGLEVRQTRLTEEPAGNNWAFNCTNKTLCLTSTLQGYSSAHGRSFCSRYCFQFTVCWSCLSVCLFISYKCLHIQKYHVLFPFSHCPMMCPVLFYATRTNAQVFEALRSFEVMLVFVVLLYKCCKLFCMI